MCQQLSYVSFAFSNPSDWVGYIYKYDFVMKRHENMSLCTGSRVKWQSWANASSELRAPGAPEGRLNIKMPSYQYRDCHVKDKKVSPTVLSLTWESPYLGKTVFILRWGPESQRHIFSTHCCSQCANHLAMAHLSKILLSMLTSLASDLFNYSLRLDNELSARPPRGPHGLWTALKIQMGCLQIVWWN